MLYLKQTLKITLQDFHLELNCIEAVACLEKALYLPQARTLLVSDLHFGKASHFRRSGIAVPNHPEEENLARLEALVQRLGPEQIVFSGDMFHSRANQSLMRFEQWRRSLPHVQMKLVPGNHDILPAHTYAHMGIDKLDGDWTWEHLSVCHDPLDAGADPGRYYLAGHLHPGFRLAGQGGEAVTLPCLLLGSSVGLMPAFGSFTGLSVVRPKEGDRVVLFGKERLYSLPLGSLK